MEYNIESKMITGTPEEMKIFLKGVEVTTEVNKKEEFEFIGNFPNGIGIARAKSRKNRKFGYINTRYEWVVEPIYDMAFDIENNAVYVKRENDWYFLDDRWWLGNTYSNSVPKQNSNGNKPKFKIGDEVRTVENNHPFGIEHVLGNESGEYKYVGRCRCSGNIAELKESNLKKEKKMEDAVESNHIPDVYNRAYQNLKPPIDDSLLLGDIVFLKEGRLLPSRLIYDYTSLDYNQLYKMASEDGMKIKGFRDKNNVLLEFSSPSPFRPNVQFKLHITDIVKKPIEVDRNNCKK